MHVPGTTCEYITTSAGLLCSWSHYGEASKIQGCYACHFLSGLSFPPQMEQGASYLNKGERRRREETQLTFIVHASEVSSTILVSL